MKKIFSIITFFIVFTTGIFALELPLSIGFGGLLDYNFTNISADHVDYALSGKLGYSTFNYGLFTFFDAYYVEAGLGFAGIATSIKTDAALPKANGGIDPEDINLTGNMLILSLYGKFPFNFDGFSIYPLVGIEGQIVLAMLYAEDSPKGWNNKKKWDSYQGSVTDWSAFWFRVGAGADFFLSDSFFIRSELTYGLKANTSREKLIIENLANDGNYNNIEAWCMGGKLTISIGYTFSTTNLSNSGAWSGGGSSSSGGEDNIYYPR